MAKHYPLPEHIKEPEYPFNTFGTGDDGKFIMTMDDEGILAALEAIRDAQGFITHWSVGGLDQRFMDQEVPFPVHSIITPLTKMEVTLPVRKKDLLEPLTWFDLWVITDSLVRLEIDLCGEGNPSYIEGFIPKGNDRFEVKFGS